MKSIMRYTLLLLILLTFTQGGYIHAKALLAQHLLEFAWAQSVASNTAIKPWPWADTQAVANLHIAKLDLNLIVLKGTSGEAMAFGPSLNQNVNSNASSAYVIGGHRDTHMQFMKDLSVGDAVSLTTIDGVARSYTINRSFIANTRTDRLMLDKDKDALILITCYPFDAILAGGPLRLIMLATPVEQGREEHPELVPSNTSEI